MNDDKLIKKMEELKRVETEVMDYPAGWNDAITKCIALVKEQGDVDLDADSDKLNLELANQIVRTVGMTLDTGPRIFEALQIAQKRGEILERVRRMQPKPTQDKSDHTCGQGNHDYQPITRLTNGWKDVCVKCGHERIVSTDQPTQAVSQHPCEPCPDKEHCQPELRTEPCMMFPEKYNPLLSNPIFCALDNRVDKLKTDLRIMQNRIALIEATFRKDAEKNLNSYA